MALLLTQYNIANTYFSHHIIVTFINHCQSLLVMPLVKERRLTERRVKEYYYTPEFYGNTGIGPYAECCKVKY